MGSALLPRKCKQPINRIKRDTEHQGLEAQRLAQDVSEDVLGSPVIGFVVSDVGKRFFAAVLGFDGKVTDRAHRGVGIGLQERFDGTKAIMQVAVFDMNKALFGIVPRAKMELFAERRQQCVVTGVLGDLSEVCVKESLDGREVEFGVMVSGDDVDLVTCVQKRDHALKYPRIQRQEVL